ncbi:p21-C-terminal region-binding protein [Nitzschia inconspicua]|uniref:P21-C-terminal region-binding protein n=1 Tax=Nitzschia inconspicua TaxID=303405 RepID=A0A9K3PGK4_9STRA|nr:p21-C-terminal region-binding protein [Nitzschia inconspicua]
MSDEDDDHSQRKRKTPDNVEGENNDDDDDDDSSSDEDLVLEGVIVRNEDASDSEESSDEEEQDDADDKADDSKPAAKRSEAKRPSKADGSNDTKEATQETETSRKDSNKKRKKKAPGPEIIPVEFTFCDMDERYFHGIKTLLISSSPLYATTSSAMADLMIENIAVGTVISTEADREEGTVYGFASVLNVTTYQERECVQSLKALCLSKCPPQHKSELETVLSGKTKRPAGFLLQSRMVNLPLEIVEVLHQQLVLDMDWAVEKAEGGEEERKSFDFGAFVRLAPSYRSSGASYYKYFDDEVFAQNAEFTYEIALPKTHGMEETPYCTVIVMTKTGHRAAMKDLKQMVYGDAVSNS